MKITKLLSMERGELHPLRVYPFILNILCLSDLNNSNYPVRFFSQMFCNSLTEILFRECIVS